MKKYEIVVDTSHDLEEVFIKENGVKEASFYIRLNSDEFLKDQIDINRRELYDYLAANKDVYPKTSLPSVDDYCSMFKDIAEGGKDIICITVSSTLSGSYQSANVAANIVREEYPDRKIYVIDSESASLGVGILVEKAVEYRDSDMDIDTCMDKITKIAKATKIYIALDTLSYLEHGGRISRTQAVAGRLLNLKPVVSFKDNTLSKESTARSMKKAVNKILDYTYDEIGDDIDRYEIFVIHGDVEDLARDIQRQIEEKYNRKIYPDVPLVSAPVISHIGPGAVAIGIMEIEDK